MNARTIFVVAAIGAATASCNDCAAAKAQPQSAAPLARRDAPKKIDMKRCEHPYRAEPIKAGLFYPPGENPQGQFVEGPGFERRHFEVNGGTLTVKSVCGGNPKMKVSLKSGCNYTAGPARCLASVYNGDKNDLQMDEPIGVCGWDVAVGDTVDVGVTALLGYWDDHGNYVDDKDTVTLSCNALATKGQNIGFDGAIAKCVNLQKDHAFEYPPSFGGERENFLACIRAVRADYCGDGSTATKSGTLIDMYDRFKGADHHASACDRNVKSCLEAEWNEQGAVCIAHARWSARQGAYPVTCTESGSAKARFDTPGPCLTHCRSDKTVKKRVVTRSRHQNSDGTVVNCDRATEADPECSGVCPR